MAPALPPDVRTVIPEDNLMPVSDSPPGLEPMLLEVQLSRMARRVLLGYWAQDQLLLPVTEWLDFIQVAYEGTGSRISGKIQPAGTAFSFD
ncbi:MAG TPA: hypothetical protein VHH32_08065, partial [Gemmatimonadales bacterium]|nr:hypothetical protein [Gemmatimonadales bacterium]